MYNGHKNYNCWNVSLYIDNEYSLYDLTRRSFKLGFKKDHIASIIFCEMLALYGTHTPDNVRITFSNVREHLRNLTRKDFE